MYYEYAIGRSYPYSVRCDAEQGWRGLQARRCGPRVGTPRSTWHTPLGSMGVIVPAGSREQIAERPVPNGPGPFRARPPSRTRPGPSPRHADSAGDGAARPPIASRGRRPTRGVM
eukprot:7387280-Prymnesium_polylepis.3